METNNVKFIRLRRNKTIDNLVDITGIPKTTLHRIENGGSKKMLDKYRDKLAAALHCSADELDSDDLNDGVPIIGEIKFKCYVKVLPKDKWKEAEAVEGLPETSRAVRVIGTHLIPSHGRNDILYFDGEPAKHPSQFVNKQCLVQIDKGNTLIAWVAAGSKPNHYLLHHYGSPQVMVDQKILKAHPVLHVKRG